MNRTSGGKQTNTFIQTTVSLLKSPQFLYPSKNIQCISFHWVKIENNRNTDIIWFLLSFSQENTGEVMTPVLLNYDLFLRAPGNIFPLRISVTKSRKHRESKRLNDSETNCFLLINTARGDLLFPGVVSSCGSQTLWRKHRRKSSISMQDHAENWRLLQHIYPLHTEENTLSHHRYTKVL